MVVIHFTNEAADPLQAFRARRALCLGIQGGRHRTDRRSQQPGSRRALSASGGEEGRRHVRFSVVTYGSEGDTRPFVAISRGLINAGHEVQLFAEQSSVYIAQAHGIPFETFAGDVKATLTAR